MTFRPALWRPIALTVTALNLAGAGFAIAGAEPVHASVHVALALAFGYWAHRLRGRGARGEESPRLEQLEADFAELRGELGEAQERIDFIERVLAREAEPRRVDPGADQHDRR